MSDECRHDLGWVATWNGMRWVWRCKSCKAERE